MVLRVDVFPRVVRDSAEQACRVTGEKIHSFIARESRVPALVQEQKGVKRDERDADVKKADIEGEDKKIRPPKTRPWDGAPTFRVALFHFVSVTLAREATVMLHERWSALYGLSRYQKIPSTVASNYRRILKAARRLACA